MRIVGIMPVRNEDWCLEAALKQLLRWCHGVVIINHKSTDATQDAIEQVMDDYPGRIVCKHDDSEDWNEADQRQLMLTQARKWFNPDLVAIVDADECLSDNLVQEVPTWADTMQPGELMWLPWRCLWRSMTRYRADNTAFGRGKICMLVKDTPQICFRPKDGGYQYHARKPHGYVVDNYNIKVDGGILHWQHANWHRLQAKQALYKMTERIRWNRSAQELNLQYDGTVSEVGMGVADVPKHWIPTGLLEEVKINAAPWQYAECRRLLEVHGREAFDGLNLYGIV